MLIPMEDAVREILELAREGVYRDNIFLWLDCRQTHKKIAEAIMTAKKRGMYSVPNMRCPHRGTYYQYDG